MILRQFPFNFGPTGSRSPLGHAFAHNAKERYGPLNPLQTILLSMIGPAAALLILAAQERSRKTRVDRMLHPPERPSSLGLQPLPGDRSSSRPQSHDSELPSLIYPASLARVFPLTLPPEMSPASPRRRSLN